MRTERRPVMERILEKVEKRTDGCWIWTGCTYANGYGQVNLGGRHGKRRAVHRVTYEHLVGEIPEGLDLDHLCRNRACCNPDHLEPVSRKENARRGLKGVLKTHCVQGHEYTADNILIDRHGYRYCRECNRLRSRARYQAKAAA